MEIELNSCYKNLSEGGIFITSYRDYSIELTDTNRFIPVRSDENRILTLLLDFEDDKVLVTDLLHEKSGDGWNQKLSSYYKLRLNQGLVEDFLLQNGFQIIKTENRNRMFYTIAKK